MQRRRSHRTGAEHAPTAEILSPAGGAEFIEGDEITFQASATDAKGRALWGSSIVWRSHLDGEIGTSETFTSSALSVGEHMIGLTATDSRGATGADSVAIKVKGILPPTAEVLSPADSPSPQARKESMYSSCPTCEE